MMKIMAVFIETFAFSNNLEAIHTHLSRLKTCELGTGALVRASVSGSEAVAW